MVSSVGLVLHPTKLVDTSVDTVLAFARRHPVRVLAREADRDRVPPGVAVVPEDEFVASAEALVALGGDGTMLGALRLTVGRPVPVLGVNHGNLGFLVEVAPAQLSAALSRLEEGDFTIEQHACLDVGSLPIRYGFNDLVLGRAGRSGAVSVDLTVNGLRYGYYRGDAVIVSTPTGSTAYNYAAGGPVLSPSSQAFVITPVAPMAGIGRPVVLGAGDRVTLSVAKDSGPIAVDVDGLAAGELRYGGGLTSGGPGRGDGLAAGGPGRGDGLTAGGPARGDGLAAGELGHGGRVTAALRVNAAQVVRLSASEHASRSRVKLSLLDLPLRRDQLIELIPPELRRPHPPSLGE